MKAPEFDGTIKSLIRCYATDPVSRYRKLRFDSRSNLDRLLRRIDFDYGDVRIEAIRYKVLLEWHAGWSAGGKLTIAHGLVGCLRALIGFGTTILENPECARLRGVLSEARFPMPKPRTERMTYDQAVAVVAMAHTMKLPSIALAQAFQFECMLRQKDVIGEWVPQREPGTSDVLHEGRKWLCGLRWSEVDGNLVLRHVTSKRQKLVEFDLRRAPMVMQELDRGSRGGSGPIIIYEATGLPYWNHQFRRVWRQVATAAGVPKTVYNMDSRAGAISEATDAGASLEQVRHAATHSNTSTTANYSRGSSEKIREVQGARLQHRAKRA